ncbi:MAG: short-chain dehydrogenase/reductase SDR [Puniceicoccaceae bacterium 5H]|nr:MAG: short-chain dehydrogenase/reductase SDR [Puniceicoccaceae bacterium 5H]
MQPQPKVRDIPLKGSDRLEGKKALITGGDSGIGAAAAVAFAREGADVAFIYLNEGDDAERTRKAIEGEGAHCVALAGDVGDRTFCKRAVEQVVEAFGQIDVLVNNAGEQHVCKDFAQIDLDTVEQTFRTNVFGAFAITRYALPHMPEGSAIINSTSVTAYRGSGGLVDYASTKGALAAFTRSLATHLAPRKIRVNGVAPGPVWTPLIPASFDEDKVDQFGGDNLMGRPGQPNELAASYVFLASQDASFYTGQVLHPNGGEIVNA